MYLEAFCPLIGPDPCVYKLETLLRSTPTRGICEKINPLLWIIYVLLRHA